MSSQYEYEDSDRCIQNDYNLIKESNITPNKNKINNSQSSMSIMSNYSHSSSRNILGEFHSNKSPITIWPNKLQDGMLKEQRVMSIHEQKGVPSEARYTSNNKSHQNYLSGDESQSENIFKCDIQKLSLEEIDRELENNTLELNQLLSRRKNLILSKKKKIKSDFYFNNEKLKKTTCEELYLYLSKNPNLSNDNLQYLKQNASRLARMEKLMHTITQELNTSAQERQKFELIKSNEFWCNNKGIENSVDQLLKDLKYQDDELEKSNEEIQEISKTLDHVEEGIRELMASKIDEQIKRAEPLFQHKQKCHEMMKNEILQRDQFKDEKIHIIQQILDQLTNLKYIREKRLKQLMELFCIDETSESSKKISNYLDFVDQLENIAKIKENIQEYENSEDEIVGKLEQQSREVSEIMDEFNRSLNDEQNAYKQLQNNFQQRYLLQAQFQYFMSQANLDSICHLDIKEILRKFKENILFLKPLVEEDVTIKQGLQKTCETIQTFQTILDQQNNDRDRNNQLLTLLENALRLKMEEEQKTEILRNLELEITKKVSQKNHLEEDFELILNDADLDQYKKHAHVQKNFDLELQKYHQKKQIVQKEIQEIHDKVVQIQLITSEYEDILKEIVPSNFLENCDLNEEKDIKQMKHYLKKAFKRLGIMPLGHTM